MRLQGCERSSFAERGADLYETPPAAVHALAAVEELPPVIWEPCAGRGAIMRELVRLGFRVVAHDLHAWPDADRGIIAGRDFFRAKRAPVGISCIITNPPFKMADAFVRHGLELVPRVIVLQRLAALEGAGRSDLIDYHLRRVWLGRERLPMMHREGWNGRKLKVAGAPFAWFVFEHEPRHQPAFAITRISWRGALPQAAE
jgi:hypothetical protein